jgi:hypothetical protein
MFDDMSFFFGLADVRTGSRGSETLDHSRDEYLSSVSASLDHRIVRVMSFWRCDMPPETQILCISG